MSRQDLAMRTKHWQKFSIVQKVCIAYEILLGSVIPASPLPGKAGFYTDTYG
jgi:hypothetical protein